MDTKIVNETLIGCSETLRRLLRENNNYYCCGEHESFCGCYNPCYCGKHDSCCRNYSNSSVDSYDQINHVHKRIDEVDRKIEAFDCMKSRLEDLKLLLNAQLSGLLTRQKVDTCDVYHEEYENERSLSDYGRDKEDINFRRMRKFIKKREGERKMRKLKKKRRNGR